ncbi:Receptor kinase-like protein Xa21 [Linum grandiflorum]
MKDYNQNSHFLSFLLISLHYLILNASGNNLTDQLALLEFKNSITNDPDGILASWNDSLHFCNWLGITCNTQQRVTSLSLSSCNLAGTLSPHISNFPEDIGLTVPNLRGYYISRNWMTGPIPQSFCNASKLYEINMNQNSLTGSIPTCFGILSGFMYLNVGANNLGTGKAGDFDFITGLSNCSKLGELGVSENNLGGPLPNSLGNLSDQLYQLYLGVNPIGGNIPEGLKNLKLWRSRKKSVAVGDTILSHFVMVSYKDLHQGTNGFSDDNLIGSGGFGTIYKGVLDQLGPATLVAVKVLNIQENIRLAHKSLLAECNALKNVRHRNLVRVLTYCSSLDHKGNDFKALVFEFMSNGSLEDWLHSDRNLMSLVQRLNIMVDVASALHYLHDLCETPVVHCDLKPSNVLLDADMVAHVGDFGLARILSSNNNSPGNESSTIGIRGT